MKSNYMILWSRRAYETNIDRLLLLLFITIPSQQFYGGLYDVVMCGDERERSVDDMTSLPLHMPYQRPTTTHLRTSRHIAMPGTRRTGRQVQDILPAHSPPPITIT